MVYILKWVWVVCRQPLHLWYPRSHHIPSPTLPGSTPQLDPPNCSFLLPTEYQCHCKLQLQVKVWWSPWLKFLPNFNYVHVVVKTNKSHNNSFEFELKLWLVYTIMNRCVSYTETRSQLHLVDRSLLHLHCDHSHGYQLPYEGNHQGLSHLLCSPHCPRK